MATMLSVIIPTLCSANVPPALLERLGGHEVILVDGGPGEVASPVIKSPAGRGIQLAKGAEAATGDWLLFLHEDSILAPDWQDHLKYDPDKAMVFRFALDYPGRWARVLESIVGLRCCLFALPYGDQGLLISRALYDQVGGFRDMVLMEDVDMVRRLGRTRLYFSDHPLKTSAVRYRAGPMRRMLKNAFCLTLYFCGVSVERIKRIYE